MVIDLLESRLGALKKAIEDIDRDFHLKKKIGLLYNNIVDVSNRGGIVYFIGNGGSASDSEHLANEFNCKFGALVIDKEAARERYKYSGGVESVKCVSLTDVAAITALGNDFGYDDVFRMQLANCLTRNDLLIALTTSGSSKNIVNAVNFSSTIGVRSWVVGGAKLEENSYLYDNELGYFNYIAFPTEETELAQELYKNMFHTIYKKI